MTFFLKKKEKLILHFMCSACSFENINVCVHLSNGPVDKIQYKFLTSKSASLSLRILNVHEDIMSCVYSVVQGWNEDGVCCSPQAPAAKHKVLCLSEPSVS